MKTVLSDVRVRIAAYIAGILASIILIASIGGMVVMYGLGTKEEALELGYQPIAENYMAYIVEEYWNNPEEVISTMEESNLYFKIIENIPIVNGYMVYDDESTYIYSNVPDDYEMKHTYLYQGTESEYFNYNTRFLLRALRYPYSYGENTYDMYTKINGLVYNHADSLFYVNTGDGYFKVPYLLIKENGRFYNYLINEENEHTYYYDETENKVLDIDTIASWQELSLGYSTDSIAYLMYTDAEIMENIYFSETGTEIGDKYIERDYYTDGEFLYYSYGTETVYTVVADMTPELIDDNLFMEWNRLISWIYSFENSVVFIEFISAIILILSIVVLIYGAPGEKEKLRFWHKIPLCIYLGCVIFAELGLGALGGAMIQLVQYNNTLNISVSALACLFAQLIAVMVFMLFRAISNLATRIKSKTLFRYSELYYVCRPVMILVKLAKENIPLFWKVMIATLIVDVIEFIAFLIIIETFCYYYVDAMMFVIFILYKFVQFVAIVFVVMQMARLQKGTERIANADFSQPIDTKKMFWEFKKHGDNINKVGDGIKKAVESQLKSERLKTELITNVSHDIKTPLTSIINYVDLIKKEELTDPTLCEYVDVLDRQSARLKKLIEDLMEASKASTGNIKVEPEECDITVLLTQVVGEFEERLAASNLETVILKPEEELYILADGRHMWRVLDNLMNNICKYSLPNSRVYVEVAKMAGDVQIRFKNISKSQLNISSDELMERFVRGDSSRNTEGSGLGLSIARSLTELMNGSMNLDIDGDLFKVTLIFPIYDKPEAIADENAI